jgi:hypothetical protein
VWSPLLKPLLKKKVYQGRRNHGAGGSDDCPDPRFLQLTLSQSGGADYVCSLSPPPGFSDLPTALMQEKKRREVNVGNNRDVHQVSMHSGRTRQKLIRHRLQLQCVACSKMPKPVHTVHQWFLQLTNLWGELDMYFDLFLLVVAVAIAVWKSILWHFFLTACYNALAVQERLSCRHVQFFAALFS